MKQEPNESTYAAMRAYIDLAVQLGVEKKVNEIRAALPVETRATEPVVGKDGKDGLNGKDGRDGKDGTNGKDGLNGIPTLEDLDAVVEKRIGEINVRTFADVYKGTYQPDTDYTRGVLVTWGGSLWLSQIDTRRKPGETADWKLVVKKGADARK